jgi:hypothetical protein
LAGRFAVTFADAPTVSERFCCAGVELGEPFPKSGPIALESMTMHESPLATTQNVEITNRSFDDTDPAKDFSKWKFPSLFQKWSKRSNQKIMKELIH